MAEQKELRFKGKIEEDVEGHTLGFKCAIVLTDPDDVSGHGYKFGLDLTGEDVEGHSYKFGLEAAPDDVQGHFGRFGIELEDGDVRGHLHHLEGSEATGTDGDGNTVKLVIDKVEGDDVEGHINRF
jgi:hypothetical protein